MAGKMSDEAAARIKRIMGGGGGGEPTGQWPIGSAADRGLPPKPPIKRLNTSARKKKDKKSYA